MLPDPAKSYAVLVGVSSYRDLTPLNAVANNVRALANLLIDRDVWGLPVDQCQVVCDPATVDEVLEKVHRAAYSARAALLVYFAGHGLLDQKSDLYLALPDGASERLHRAVPYGAIRHEVRVTAQCPAKVVILDCCYSGAAMGEFMSDPLRSLASKAAVEGAYLMTASAATAQALAPSNARYTAFTGALVETIDTGIPHGAVAAGHGDPVLQRRVHVACPLCADASAFLSRRGQSHRDRAQPMGGTSAWQADRQFTQSAGQVALGQ